MTAWRGDLVPNQSVIRIIDDVDEFRRLCERRAPGAEDAVTWVDEMAEFAGREFTIEGLDEDDRAYNNDQYRVPFDACILVRVRSARAKRLTPPPSHRRARERSRARWGSQSSFDGPLDLVGLDLARGVADQVVDRAPVPPPEFRVDSVPLLELLLGALSAPVWWWRWRRGRGRGLVNVDQFEVLVVGGLAHAPPRRRGPRGPSLAGARRRWWSRKSLVVVVLIPRLAALRGRLRGRLALRRGARRLGALRQLVLPRSMRPARHPQAASRPGFPGDRSRI